MDSADQFLNIPMVGFTESLNISVSASIILQELSFRLRRSGIPWQFSEEEKAQKRFEWAVRNLKSSRQIIERFQASH